MSIVDEYKGKNPFIAILTKIGVVAGCSFILYFIAERLVIDVINFIIKMAMLLLGY